MISFSRNVLEIDCAAEAERIGEWMREAVGRKLRKRGVVVAVSGGVDSSVCAAVAATVLGAERVRGLLLPEQDSSPATTDKGRRVCEQFGIEYKVIDIAPVLEALGCYRHRDEAIRKVFPDFGPGYRQKITVAEGMLNSDRLNYFNLTVQSPDGQTHKQRMPLDVYLAIVAATNMKQRTRKLLEYHEAEHLNFAVLGTPNLLEYDQGFFVRGGDGLADLKPIAHLYKTQVYAMARHFKLPEDVCTQTPSTDTYSLPQTQEEFYFALPYGLMDLALWAYSHDVPAEEAAGVLDLAVEQVERAYRDIVAKRRVAELLHQHALAMT
jgi:NAD+ synthase